MCYAVSTSSDPLGPWYRYEFVRPLFPDHPRPAVWPDGYYVPTSTGDTVIQKQAFVVDRTKMLKGEDATEQGVIDGVNFLNNAHVDGRNCRRRGRPDLVLAAGGTQLKRSPGRRRHLLLEIPRGLGPPVQDPARGPTKIAVAPYHHLGDGQLTRRAATSATPPRPPGRQANGASGLPAHRRGSPSWRCTPSPRRRTAAACGGMNSGWTGTQPTLFQQGTYCPDGDYRWLGNPAMDPLGNIGIGYSFGGLTTFPGQRFAGRLAVIR